MAKRRHKQPEMSTPVAPPPQKAKIMAAAAAAPQSPTATDDLDFAFQLQMKEAIADSVFQDDDIASASHLLLAEEMREDFDRQTHDRKVALEISAIPDHEWEATGDDYQRPYSKTEMGSTSSSSTTTAAGEGDQVGFRLYFKGVVEEVENKGKLGAIGVAILDPMNAVVFEVSKALDLPETEMEEEVAELEAFVDGLEFAFSLELRTVSYCSGDFNVDQFLYGNKKPKETRVAELVDRAVLLKKQFLICHSLVASISNAQIVLDLARSSIAKQAGKLVEHLFLKEKCNICLEDVDSKKIFENGQCQHRFCSSCTQKHIEIKVRGRELPLCAHPNCRIILDTEACKKFLTREMSHILDQLVKESLIPASEKVYCPNPTCSSLMSKTEAIMNAQFVASTRKVALRVSRCPKCNKRFCIDCKVLWELHIDMPCDMRKLDPSSTDGKLKELARSKKWRQCPMCSHMVELALGCNHIYCRCGHEFCYVCGFEWKNKRATCSCPLWAEENIIRQGGFNGQ